MQIKIDITRVYEMMKTFKIEDPRFLTRTINATIRNAKTEVTAEIAADINLTKTFIQKQTGKTAEQTFKTSFASATQGPRYSGKLVTKSANIPLIYLSNQRGVKKAYAKTVSALVKRARGRVRLKHAFAAVMPSGHRGIFEIEQPVHKSSTGRPVIKQLYTGRIPDFMINTETISDIEKKIQARLDKNINTQLDYFLSKL